MQHYTGLLGIAVFLLLASMLSEDRRRFPVRLVLSGLALQFLLAFLLLRFEPVVFWFRVLGHWVNSVISAADRGSVFLFGSLADPGGPAGWIFATKVLPVIIMFAALMAVLYHLGIMQRVIAGLAWLLRRTMGVTGTEAMAMAANVFVGQTEAPLCVRPFIPKMTRSQLATLMVGGFATIAGSVLAAYVGMLAGEGLEGRFTPEEIDERRIQLVLHFITASVLSAPAAFVMAKIIVPEREQPVDEGIRILGEDRQTRNVLDAAAAGATDGLRLALNVAAMLIAFVSLLAVVNLVLGGLGRVGLFADALAALGVDEPLSLEILLGWGLSPLAWLMGAPWAECAALGELLGQKIVVTEFIAYDSLKQDMHGDDPRMSERTQTIAMYALCGFANFPSIAIQIGGLTALAPSRRSEFASLGLRAMLGGALASWMTACIAGIFIW